jgi:hypothetical protein
MNKRLQGRRLGCRLIGSLEAKTEISIGRITNVGNLAAARQASAGLDF